MRVTSLLFMVLLLEVEYSHSMSGVSTLLVLYLDHEMSPYIIDIEKCINLLNCFNSLKFHNRISYRTIMELIPREWALWTNNIPNKMGQIYFYLHL